MVDYVIRLTALLNWDYPGASVVSATCNGEEIEVDPEIVENLGFLIRDGKKKLVLSNPYRRFEDEYSGTPTPADVEDALVNATEQVVSHLAFGGQGGAFGSSTSPNSVTVHHHGSSCNCE